VGQGFASAQLRYEYFLDLRYVGQGYDLTIALDDVPGDADAMQAIRLRFDAEHAQLTGHAAPDEHVEIVNYRLSAVAAVPHASIASSFPQTGRLDAARLGERQTYFDGETAQTTALYDRTKLPPDAVIDGPAILLQSDATTVINRGQRARVVELGQLEIVSATAPVAPRERALVGAV
jgi:N-methylhydantoinase A